MKFISCILLCFTMTACSSTKVHLYTRYLTDSEIKTISEELESADFEVIPNNLTFPDTIHQSTLLYSPFIQDEDSLESITNTLTKLGWIVPSVQSLVSGNHWYKKDSVGLFLLPEGVKQNDKVAQQDLVNVYESRNCTTSVKVYLKADHSYQFVFANKDQEQTDHLSGTWKMRSYPYIELTSDNQIWWFYFNIEKKQETDKVSNIEIVELHPEDKYKFFPNCSFAYGIRK
ncbi:hypothetical protein E2K93_11840 [Thalassotalea sp. HSM 43]|uniref:hypothetical protein n=1 Tax=Thalassotalea sp. HSM 43 TaxID=2552945 RepID=UPI00108196CC|nr:hypothetical protein [Thalassotalea sp. HSM 43]QBY05033.1 hypothetical protein E2K93_11840 [Thalassotalea sp. HSM 43]